MSKSAKHYLPNGKEYTGPTHKLGATIMTGAKHTDKSQKLGHAPPKTNKK